MTCNETINDGFGENIEALRDLRGNGVPDVVFERSPCGKSADAVAVRFKTVDALAVHIDMPHSYRLPDGSTEHRRAGWFVKGPGGFYFYVREEDFSKFFEITEE